MIHVVAIITAKPDQRAAVLEHFQANVPAVRAETGCIEYAAAVDLENMGTAAYGPDAFVVIEKWESEDHLKAHAAAPQPPAVIGKSWVVGDLSSNQMLAAEKSDERIEPASLTKIMTAYVVFQALREERARAADDAPPGLRG